MLIEISDHLRGYFYDVFVTRFDFWLVFGILAQLVFGSRFILQWIASERAGRSVMPLSFWFLSIAGGIMTLVYGFVRREPVIIIGQGLSTGIYLRNLALIFRERRRARAAAGDSG
ncbi:lipid-A-disaccharide synthase N-terminal domain-containing protein [Methylobacterium nigriterrae]|uniref:lipid-A-disaccharide synthase N-terminal domain-containing protein n=1 Tax=Methylobacterium nigriterrae TaxID=3127512 RepID=UPI003013DC38